MKDRNSAAKFGLELMNKPGNVPEAGTLNPVDNRFIRRLKRWLMQNGLKLLNSTRAGRLNPVI